MVAVVAAVCVGVSIKVATLHNKQDGGGSLEASTTSENDTSTPEQSTLTEFSSLSVPSANASSIPPQSYHKLPKWVLAIFDILIFFLFGLSGVAVPSIASFWYYAIFLLLSIMWSIHFKYAQSIIRIIRLVSLVYTAIHILVLYLYQFQSFQLVAPSTSFDSTNDLLLRLVKVFYDDYNNVTSHILYSGTSEQRTRWCQLPTILSFVERLSTLQRF